MGLTVIHDIKVYKTLCPKAKALKPRTASVRTLYSTSDTPSKNDDVLDPQALLLYFPAPRSATGEDVLEMHVHGGPAVVKSVLGAISQCKQVHPIRYADPGEFTQRAFFNGRLDLTQVEALGDTLHAVTEQQRRLAVRGTGGNVLTRQYELWRQHLLEARGELEALIDFSEDQHFDESPAVLAASVAKQVQKLVENIQIFKKNAVKGEMLRKGIGITLVGEPNAGKSSLLNRIVGREAAIVNQEAGTTRDIVEVSLDIKGWYCRMSDTAGLREYSNERDESTTDVTKLIGEVEREGMRRARERVLESDLVIVILPLEATNALTMKETNLRLNLDQQVLDLVKESYSEGKSVLAIINKIDKIGTNQAAILTNIKKLVKTSLPFLSMNKIFTISCKDVLKKAHSENADPGNIPLFLEGLVTCFEDMTAAISGSTEINAQNAEIDKSVWETSLGASERHRLLLEECQGHLEHFLDTTRLNNSQEESVDIVVAAESLRAAAVSIGKIIGREGGAGDVEEVLGVVFEK